MNADYKAKCSGTPLTTSTAEPATEQTKTTEGSKCSVIAMQVAGTLT